MAVQCEDMTFYFQLARTIDYNLVTRVKYCSSHIFKPALIFFLSIDTNLSFTAGVFPDCINNHEKV